jgi:hypothetical protein
LVALAYVAPALCVYVGFAIWPAIHTVYLSFLHWDGILPATPAGFSNHTAVFTDPTVRPALGRAIVLLMTALLQGGVRGMTAFRVVFFLPQVLPLVAVGVTWRWLYGGRERHHDDRRARRFRPRLRHHQRQARRPDDGAGPPRVPPRVQRATSAAPARSRWC